MHKLRPGSKRWFPTAEASSYSRGENHEHRFGRRVRHAMVRPPAAGAEISARESAVSFWPLFSLCYQCFALVETRIGASRISRRCGPESSRCGPRGLVGEFLPPRTICSSFRRGLEIDLQVLDGIQRTGFALSLGEHRTSLFGC